MNMGGAETLLMNLYRNIDRNTMQFDFAIHVDSKCLFEDEIKSLGGKIYRFKKFNGINFFQYRKQWTSFFKEHSEHSIVHGHIGSCAFLYLAIANKFNKVTIAHSHNVRKKHDFSIHNILWSFYAYPTRKIANYFVGCSKKSGIDRFGKKVANSEKFFILKNGIDSNRFRFDENTRNQIRRDLNLENKFVIGHIGRFVNQKNHSFLIDIFYKYLEKNPNSMLVLVGDGPLKKKIKDKVNLLNLNDKIIFTGTRTDTEKLLCAFDLFVFPSLNEGLGISVIEAQALGLNVLSSDVIPNETQISNNIILCSLKKNATYWANLIKTESVIDRSTSYENLHLNDFDIKDSSAFLEKLYLSILE